MSEFITRPGFLIKSKFEKHKEMKGVLLQLIDKIPKESVYEVDNSDWNLPVDYKSEYLDIFYELVRPTMDEIANQLCCKKWIITNGWFQQYTSGYHKWHNHAGVHFSSVYYLELPNSKFQTKFLNPMNKKLHGDIIIEEGDIIATPAFIPHTSIVQPTKERNTVIVFNSVFDDVDDRKIQELFN